MNGSNYLATNLLWKSNRQNKSLLQLLFVMRSYRWFYCKITDINLISRSVHFTVNGLTCAIPPYAIFGHNAHGIRLFLWANLKKYSICICFTTIGYFVCTISKVSNSNKLSFSTFPTKTTTTTITKSNREKQLCTFADDHHESEGFC